MENDLGMSKKIESHGSFLTNRRINALFMEVDACALRANRHFHLNSVVAYFSALEQIYINVGDIILDEKVFEAIEEVRGRYYYAEELQNTNKRYHTAKLLLFQLRALRAYNRLLIHGMQKDMEYFFRTGQRQRKGLQKINFHQDSIFSTKKRDKDAIKEDQE